MVIKKIHLKNFKLFEDEYIEPKGLNIFIGDNRDNNSSNASGKSTLSLEALMFALYGNTTCNLRDTISFGKEHCEVEVTFELGEDLIVIKREIPSRLSLSINGKLKDFSTATLCQKYINDLIGDVDFFKKFRTLDLQSGINLLDLGSTSLKNTLMKFMQDYFNRLRKHLQEKKQYLNTYHIRHRKSCHIHHYSIKRIKVIDNKIEELKKEMLSSKHNPEKELAEFRQELRFNSNSIRQWSQQLDELQMNTCPTCKQKLPTKINTSLVNELQSEIEVARDRNKEVEKYIEELDKELIGKEKWLKDLTQRMQYLGGLKQNIEVSKQLQEYKYTDKDILIYSNAIKVLDNYSSLYIERWLNNLGFIIDMLLKDINMSVEFNSTKDFITIKDGEVELKYTQLSTGQKRFLNIIFKLAILMQKNLDGIIVIDEGIDALDVTNLKRLLKVFENLPFQVFLISQHEDIKTLQDVKYFRILRKNNKAKVVA